MFENDGCTMFLNGWGGLSWQTCCDVHDEAFATGTSIQEFLVANYELWRCIAVQDIFAATLAVIGVMTGGALFFFLGHKRKTSVSSKVDSNKLQRKAEEQQDKSK